MRLIHPECTWIDYWSKSHTYIITIESCMDLGKVGFNPKDFDKVCRSCATTLTKNNTSHLAWCINCYGH